MGGERGSQNEPQMSYGYDTTLHSSLSSLQLGLLIHVSSSMTGEGESPHSPEAPQSAPHRGWD